ncbi:MAG: hypothetical protein RL223_2915 [Pseudomonadota bacterium]|jgi:sterol desaturase/sphingolipid hydroxylase (fatty acid hydroxylase superfamily)
MNELSQLFDTVRLFVFERLMQPVLFDAGLGNLLEDAYDGAGWLLMGLLQLAVMLTLWRALERWRPVEPVTDRAAVRTDILFTLLHRLGAVRVLLFFGVEPWVQQAAGWLRIQGLPSVHLDQWLPGVAERPLLSFLLYLLVFDFVDYLLHRGQHRWRWWWALHAVHHSQRQMTQWSDPRNHLADDVLRDVAFAGLALLIGVPPGHFLALTALTQLVESLSHANVRLDFGPLRHWLVSPHYHRLHHAVGLGHEGRQGQGSLGGCNYAVLFPVWDRLFGTARFDTGYFPTGIRDQASGRDYGRGFWSLQWRAVARLFGRA